MSWYNTILHSVRKQFNLTHLEYCVIEMIDKLASHRAYSREGWCYASAQYIADVQLIGLRSVKRVITKAIELGLIEAKSRAGTSSLKRCTLKWHNALYNCQNEIKQGSANMTQHQCQYDPSSSANMTPNNNLHNNENNNTPVNPLQDRQKDSKDLLIREYLEAINKELSKFGKSLVIPQDDKQLKKYYAYKDVKYTIKEYKATIEQWVKVVAHKGKEWGGTENAKHLNTTTIKRHFSRYLEDSNNCKNTTSGKDASESFKNHPKWKDLYKKVQSIVPVHLRADKAKIDSQCLRFLDKFGVGVEEGVDKFDELIKNG